MHRPRVRPTRYQAHARRAAAIIQKLGTRQPWFTQDEDHPCTPPSGRSSVQLLSARERRSHCPIT